ncbi:MAG: AAA family ATPase [Bacteroidota bacterium]
MDFILNPQLELAFQYVRNTNKNIFLTGKAGTGKTTFLHQIKAEGFKRMVVLAPTGVAAINAGGMTIHSFFQLPFGLNVPGVKREETSRGFNRQKINLIRSLDLLVIDESAWSEPTCSMRWTKNSAVIVTTPNPSAASSF